MAFKIDGCPSGVYRERLGCFKDAEAEKNEMIIVSWIVQGLYYNRQLTTSDDRSLSTIWKKLERSVDRLRWTWSASVLCAAVFKVVMKNLKH